MPPRSALAGVGLTSGSAHAVVVCDDIVLPVALAPEATADQIVAAARAAAPGPLSAVTVDLSRVMLDAVLADPADVERVPRVAVIRIVPRAATDPNLGRSPSDFIENLISERHTVRGGHDLLGNELAPLDRGGLADLGATLAAGEVRQVAVVGAGSQACPDHEREVADALQATLPGALISVASEFGGQGLVGREATVALDCALRPMTEKLLDEWQAAVDAAPGRITLRVARGDGGSSTPARVRALPVVAIGARDAIELMGAAHLAALSDCRVVLPRDGSRVAGDVRHGMPVVRSAELADLGTELVVPTAALAPEPGDGAQLRRVDDVPVIVAEQHPDLLADVGAAVSKPTAWLDEVAYIESAAQLESIRREAEERAIGLVVANGAAPGSAYLAEVSTVAVPYSPSGTVRIRVRVSGAPYAEPTAGAR